MFSRIIRLLAAIATATAICGCASEPRSFYMPTADGPLPSGGGRVIGVGPVTLAEYISRPNLVIQDAPNRFAMAENHRWAGSLDDAITRVTAANLGRRLGTGNVRTYPWSSDSDLTCQVTLDIRQFHGGADGNAVLEAGWRAYRLPERTLIASRSFNGAEPLQSDGYQALVAAESRLLSRLAAEIAKALK